MIAGFRKSLRSWATVLLLFIALVAIVVTGFGTGGVGGLGSLSGGGGTSGDALASVEGQDMTVTEVNDMVNRAYSRARQQQPTLDMGTFLSQGTYEQIVDQLITARSIQAFGEAQGLIVSNRMIDREIVNIPAFRNLTGQFDQNVMRQQLQTQGLNETRFRQDVAQTLMQRQLLGPVALGARAPEGIAREYSNLLVERRRGLVAAIANSQLAQGLNPTDAELATFYNANRLTFTVPERRVLKYAVIGADQLGPAGQATEAEIAAVYRNSPQSYGARETRTIQAIVLPTQAAANAFAARVRGGTSFVEAAAAAGFSAGDVTFANQSRRQFEGVANAEVAAAAFSAPQGAVAGPIRSELGFHVARVEAINQIAGRPLEAVRGEIAAAINARKRVEALSDLVSRIEEQLADGASFEETARAHNLAIVTTPPITAVGEAGGPGFTVSPDLQPLLSPAFEVDPEQPEPAVEQIAANERFALLAIDRVIPAAPPPLAQIRDLVRTAFINQRASQLARQLAERVARAINSGTPAAQAFAQAQPRIASVRPVELRRLDISRTDQQVPAPLITLFSIPQGRARVIPGENGGGWYIVVHEQRTAGDAGSLPQLIQQTRSEFTRSASEELAQQFARAAQVRSQVTRNAAAIRSARQALSGGAPAGTE
ncbi:MAG TPA: SurA N-terminal domain-containing protein [Allosphingosinicella sp.]|nr:SurA N-terminal domain-containing protein [Allosphingosinicella sp.]